MARSHANGTYIYRAVITRTYCDGSSVVTTCGPYDKRHTAQAQITSAESQAKRSVSPYRNPFGVYSAEGRIERAEVVWVREAIDSLDQE